MWNALQWKVEWARRFVSIIPLTKSVSYWCGNSCSLYRNDVMEIKSKEGLSNNCVNFFIDLTFRYQRLFSFSKGQFIMFSYKTLLSLDTFNEFIRLGATRNMSQGFASWTLDFITLNTCTLVQQIKHLLHSLRSANKSYAELL